MQKSAAWCFSGLLQATKEDSSKSTVDQSYNQNSFDDMSPSQIHPHKKNKKHICLETHPEYMKKTDGHV